MGSENFHDAAEEIEVGWDIVSFDENGFTMNLGPIVGCFYCGVKQVPSASLKCAACGGSFEVEEIEIPKLDLDWYRFTFYSEEP